MNANTKNVKKQISEKQDSDDIVKRRYIKTKEILEEYLQTDDDKIIIYMTDKREGKYGQTWMVTNIVTVKDKTITNQYEIKPETMYYNVYEDYNLKHENIIKCQVTPDQKRKLFGVTVNEIKKFSLKPVVVKKAEELFDM